MQILLTHPGTQHAPLLAAQLHRKRLLYRFVTGIAFGDIAKRHRAKNEKPGKLAKLIAKRLIKAVPPHKIYSMPLHDIVAMVRKRMGHHNDDIYYYTNGWFEKMLPTRLLENADVVIGFDTSSRILIGRTHAVGKPFILDVSIAHPLAKEQILESLRRQYPLWSKEIKPKKQRNIDAELVEMEMADHIVVASDFSKKTYIENNVPPHKISVNPYGIFTDFFSSKWTNPALSSLPWSASHPSQPVITYLFFGSISARKGFPWLCDIWERFQAKFPNTQLIAAGHGKPPDGFLLAKGVKLIGAVHPNDRTQLFHSADVFVFPSFFEGFAQVIIEAMACGLPVVTTTHTVGPEVIDNGIEGFVIEPGEDEQLYRSMAFFMENPAKIEGMGRAARERVLPLTWDAYGDRWEKIASDVIDRHQT